MRHRVVADSWFARMFPEWFAQYHQSDPGSWVGALQLYDVPLQIVDNVTARREVDVCYMRGIGVTQTKFAQECLIDLIAMQQGRDPLEFRLRMLQGSPRAIEVLQTVARMSDWSRERDGRALGLAYTPYSNGHAALVAEVSVDRSNGEISVHEVWCATDVGLAVQPAIVASQIEGGVLQGLSMALFERVTLKDGVVQQSNFHEYPILRMSQTPQIAVQVLSTDNPIAGAGEIGVMQIAPAINNALARLIGAHLPACPCFPRPYGRRFTPEASLSCVGGMSPSVMSQNGRGGFRGAGGYSRCEPGFRSPRPLLQTIVIFRRPSRLRGPHLAGDVK